MTMHASDDRVSWEELRSLAMLGWVTGDVRPDQHGEGVILEVRYAADPPGTATRLVAGANATDAARTFRVQLTGDEG
jgi:hypothetical protein